MCDIDTIHLKWIAFESSRSETKRISVSDMKNMTNIVSLHIWNTFLTAAIVMEERFMSWDEEMRTLKARKKINVLNIWMQYK